MRVDFLKDALAIALSLLLVMAFWALLYLLVVKGGDAFMNIGLPQPISIGDTTNEAIGLVRDYCDAMMKQDYVRAAKDQDFVELENGALSSDAHAWIGQAHLVDQKEGTITACSIQKAIFVDQHLVGAFGSDPFSTADYAVTIQIIRGQNAPYLVTIEIEVMHNEDPQTFITHISRL